MSFTAYLASDRVHALAHGSELPNRAEGTALFADISGFTPLTDTLARELGQRYGAEELTRCLNAVYDAFIRVINSHGGSVVSFSGDAVTCWFDDQGSVAAAILTPDSRPLTPTAFRAVACGFGLQRAMEQVADIRTPGGQTVTLALKVAVASGTVRRLLVGDPACQQLDVLAGATMLRLAAVEHQAQAGDVVVDEHTIALLGTAVEVRTWREHDGVRAAVVAGLAEDAAGTFDSNRFGQPALLFEQARPLLLPAVAERLERGAGNMPTELRPVVALFVRFPTLDYDTDPAAAHRFDAYIRWTQDVVSRYGGVLLDVSIGDKGSYLYAAFGAPIAHENDPERAFRAALELQTPPAELAWATTPQIGITRGTMRTGAYGGDGRFTYGVLGDAVNVAARLMQAAPAGQVLVRDAVEMAGADVFLWQALPPLRVKGKPRPIAAFRLLSAQERSMPSFFQGELVAREAELAQLMTAIEPMLANRFAGVAVVQGEAGVGKSRLVFELRQRLQERSPITWAYCPSDEILRGSLRPFSTWLHAYFAQSLQGSEEQNLTRFDAKLDGLIAEIQDEPTKNQEQRTKNHTHAARSTQHAAKDPRDNGQRITDNKQLAAELIRTRSFLAALLGFRSEGSLYEQLEPKLRFENTLLALVALIKAESLQGPLLLELEDAHWLDEDSQTLLTNLTRALSNYPVAILCAARPDDQGRPFFPPLAENTPVCTVELDTLSFDGTRTLATQVLHNAVDDNLAQFVYERTDGNPFFAEQLLLDLRERGLIENREPRAENHDLMKNQEPRTENHNVEPSRFLVLGSRFSAEIPDTLNSLLVARLDRLEEPVREVVQTAAVLGREWSLPVLAAMRQGDDGLPPKVRAAEDGRVWSPLTERDYLFRHVLLRDAAYGMQLQTQRRELHERALHAIETEYAENLAPHYATLAYHARQAEDRECERRYAKLAGDAAAARYANAEAISYFSRALELTPEEDLEGRWEVLLARERVENVQGVRANQMRDITFLEQIAQFLSPEHQVLAAIRRSAYANVVNDNTLSLNAAKRAVTLVEQEGVVKLAASAYHFLAKAYLDHQEYDIALEHATHSLQIARSTQETTQEGLTLRTLDQISSFKGDYASAKVYNQQSLELARKQRNRVAEAASIGNAGHFALAQGDWLAARSAYAQCQRIFQEVGNRRADAMAYLALGEVDAHTGDYTSAIANNERGLQIVREVDDRFSQGRALCNLGEIARQSGQYKRAQEFFQQGLQLARMIKHRHSEGVFLTDLSLTNRLQGNYQAAHAYAEQALQIFQPDRGSPKRGVALLAFGHVLADLTRLDEAAEVYNEAREIMEYTKAIVIQLEALAALTRVALARGNLTEAVRHCVPILTHFEKGGTMDGADEPFWINFSVYQALHAANDPRAPAVLEDAYQRLQTRAAKFPDEATRRMFLEVPHHRELVAAWRAARS